jgi:hypothetical protein
MEARATNVWGRTSLEVSLIALLLTFGLLSPIGLLLGLIGLARAPRVAAIGGVVLGALGSFWLFATLQGDQLLRYDSGPYGTLHVVEGDGGREAAHALTVEVRGCPAGALVDLYFVEERYAYLAMDPSWEGAVHGHWWMGASPRQVGSKRADDSGVAAFDVVLPKRFVGESLRLQAMVATSEEGTPPVREVTDAVGVILGEPERRRGR